MIGESDGIDYRPSRNTSSIRLHGYTLFHGSKALVSDPLLPLQ